MPKATPRPLASGVNSHFPVSPQMAPQMAPPMPNADAVGAFIAWQLAHGDKGKGKGPPVTPFPQVWGHKSKGKAQSADPFRPMVTRYSGKDSGGASGAWSIGRSQSWGRDSSRGRDYDP